MLARELEPYDVIIVGGRPAGASLAAHLGEDGARVLILERSRFPSRPAVSASFVFPHTLQLLDELGVDERQYAAQTPRLEHFVLEFGDYFRANFRLYAKIADRTHFYTIDRQRLDDTLWRNLQRFERVQAIEGAQVLDVLQHEGRVCGVWARLPGQSAAVKLRSRCVVGADGRYSLVARKTGAKVIHRRRDVDTTLYYKHWEGVAPYEESSGPTVQIHTSCNGFSFVLMPTADHQTIVVVQGQAERYASQSGAAQEVYHSLLRAHPAVWRRLRSAQPASALSGIKRMGNLFRQAYGPGWVLTGDAYHQKDSIDAQGIYDALWSSRCLARSLQRWCSGHESWERALARYETEIYDELRPMFDVTMARVKRELYSSPPPFLAKTAMRWILTDEYYGRRFADLLTRRIDPRQFLTAKVLARSLVGGAWSRVRARFDGQPDPSEPWAAHQ